MLEEERIGATHVAITAAGPRARVDWTPYAVLAAISAVGTVFATWAYPIFDDGMWDIFYRLGSDNSAIYVGRDRPVLCWVIWCLYHSPVWLFWTASVALNFLTTWGLALFALYVARRVLPRWLALPTACLAAAPLLSRAQISLITYPLLLASMVGAFVTVHLFETAAQSGRSGAGRYWRWLAGAAIYVGAGVLTEYSVAVAAAGIVWIVLMTWFGGAARAAGVSSPPWRSAC